MCAPQREAPKLDGFAPLAQLVNGDLQYACIFPLAEPRDCSDATRVRLPESDLEYNRPLCNPPGGGEAGLTQYSAQAYPAPRLLQTLRDLGDNGVVASLRPRVATGDPEHPAFGYSAAMTSIFDRSKTLCACVACHAHSLSTTTGRSRAPSWR